MQANILLNFRHKVNNNVNKPNPVQEKPKPQEKSNVSPTKSEPCSPVPDNTSEVLVRSFFVIHGFNIIL